MKNEAAIQIAQELLPEARKLLSATTNTENYKPSRFIGEVAWMLLTARYAADTARDILPHLATLLERPESRLVVKTMVGTTQDTIGSFAVIDGHTYVCVASKWNPGDDDENIARGYYSDYAEPTAEEIASPAAVAIIQKAAQDVSAATAQGTLLRRQSNADNAGATGTTLPPREQSLLDDLFGDD